MKVIVKFDFDDIVRARLRAHHDRGGKATRTEMRVWINGLIGGHVLALPEPKTRRRAACDRCGSTTPPDLTCPECSPSKTRSASDYEAAKAAPLDAVCVHCGQTKDQHGKMGFTCMPTATSTGGKMFKAQVIQGKAGGDAQNL